MTKEEAENQLINYCEKYDDMEIRYSIIEYCGMDGDGYLFRCKAVGVTYGPQDHYPLIGVYPDGNILSLPE